MRPVDTEFQSYYSESGQEQTAKNEGMRDPLVNDSSVFCEQFVLVCLVSGEQQNDTVIGHQD